MPLYSDSDRERRTSNIPKSSLNDEDYRSDWRKDYARIIHSASFRRLQGKTQLFPYFESDFFRNRLTHSLEVAQIAKSIAIKINNTERFFQKPDNIINPDIAETAGLAHDLGHPPFGHNGEDALDDCMKNFGGFEGNAQTLRILAKIEKKEKNTTNPTGIDKAGIDQRLGLNLTYRSLASILKYDELIPRKRTKKDGRVKKGYYYSEKKVVEEIKAKVLGTKNFSDKFKTIECRIMDIADDIAYSTYDLEDAFKAGFIKPLDMISVRDPIAKQIADEVSKELKIKFTAEDLKENLLTVFKGSFEDLFEKTKYLFNEKDYKSYIPLITGTYDATNSIADNGYLRTRFSSELISLFVQSIEVKVNKKYPILSIVRLNKEKQILVETLKRYTYICLINSPILKVSKFRGHEIIKSIFEALSNDKKQGYKLMPMDYQDLYLSFKEKEDKMRIVCDFIAGMTDRYVLEFYGRLTSESPETIFKPL